MTVNTDSQQEIQKLIDGITELKGYQLTTAEKFAKGLPKFIDFYQNLPKQNKTQLAPQKVKITGDKFKNQVFAYTGFRPDDKLKQYVFSNGGKLESSVKSGVTHLLVKKKTVKKTKKILDAEKKGIHIVYLDEF